MNAHTMALDLAPPPRAALRSIRHHTLAACGLGLILFGGVGGWLHTTMIMGAVIAPGQVVVESEIKKVQHPTGGIVGELLVRNGDHVHAGDVLIRLEQTQVRANLDILNKALDELAARRARNEAERDGESVVAFPADLLERSRSDRNVARLIDGETRLFAARLAGREGQIAQLRERIRQLKDEGEGLNEQAAAKAQEMALIALELRNVRELYGRALVPLSRMTALEREEARLNGERGRLLSGMASTKGKIAETELQILQIASDMRSEAAKELSEIRGRWSELIEKRVASEDQLKRVEMRAPQDGIVHQMTVHTVGGVVTATEPAMLIVPDADRLMVEIRIQPQDIDSIRVGQRVNMRFTAFNARTTPELAGAVSWVSADVTTDAKSGVSYYTGRVAITAEEVRRLDGLRLVPGMPVEVHLQIEERSALSYLTKPLMDQAARAWKER